MFLIFQLFMPNPLKPGVKLRMKMQLQQRQQVMLQILLTLLQLGWCSNYRVLNIFTAWFIIDIWKQGANPKIRRLFAFSDA